MPLVDPGNLAALAAADMRIIACMVEICWAQDCDFASLGTWIDETGYVEAIDGTKLRHAPQQAMLVPGEGDPWALNLQLENGSGRFSAGRTDSPLTTQIAPGIYAIPVRAWVGCMEYAPVLLAPTIQGGGMDAAQLTCTVNDASTLKVGMILQAQNELMPITLITGNVLSVQRGFRDAPQDPHPAVTHAAGTPLYRAGGMVRMFSGVIIKASEDADGQSVTAECLGREHILGQDRLYSPMYTDQTEAALIATYLALLPATPVYQPVPPTQQLLQPGLTLQPYAYLHNESIWAECCKLAAAAGGWFYLNELGQAVYENAQAWLGKSVSWTFDNSELENVKPVSRFEDVYSSVTVDFSSRTLGPLQPVYNATRWFAIPPGGTLALELDLATPAINVVQPVGGPLPDTHLHLADDLRDYAATAGNHDITSSVTITNWAVYGQHVKLTFANAAPYAADVTRLVIRGQPLVGGPQEHVTKTRTPIPASLPKRDKLISNDQRYNWYLMAEPQASGLGDLLADYLCRERPVYPISAARLNPLMTVGDRVQLSWAQPFSGTPTAFVLEMAWRITGINTAETLAQMDVIAISDANLFGSANFHTVGSNPLADGSTLWY